MIYYIVTLTFDPSLSKVKVDPHAKNQGQMVKQQSVNTQTNTQTDRLWDATKRIISLASQ